MTTILNPDLRQIEVNGAAVHLTPREFEICEMLFREPGKLVKKQAMFNHLYGDDMDGGPVTGHQALDVLICYLRRKMGSIGAQGLIATEIGAGYRLDLPPTSAEARANA